MMYLHNSHLRHTPSAATVRSAAMEMHSCKKKKQDKASSIFFFVLSTNRLTKHHIAFILCSLTLCSCVCVRVRTHCVRICYTFRPPSPWYSDVYVHTYTLDPVPVMKPMCVRVVLCVCVRVWVCLDRRWQVKGGGELIYRKKSGGNISWLSWAHIFPPPPPPTPMRISLSTFSHFIFP